MQFKCRDVILLRFGWAGVAQLVEHLICNQRVGGSIPSASFARFKTDFGKGGVSGEGAKFGKKLNGVGVF